MDVVNMKGKKRWWNVIGDMIKGKIKEEMIMRVR